MKKTVVSQKDFNWVFWSKVDLEENTTQVLNYIKTEYAKIKKISPKDRTFKNTIVKIDTIQAEVLWKLGAIEILMNMSPDASVRTAAQASFSRAKECLIDIERDPEMYKAVKEVVLKKEKISPTDKKLIEDMVRAYKRMGFDLPSQQQKTLNKNLKKLSSLETKFAKNISDYKDHISVSPKETDGLSPRFLDRLTRDKKGNYLVTLAYPDVGPFMSTAFSENKRQELAIKNSQKGGLKNLDILKEMVFLRNENARLLGYKNFAEYNLEPRMAKNQKTVDSFLDNLLKKLEKKAKDDVKELSLVKARMIKNSKAKIEFFDIAYYAEKLKQERFSVDTEALSEYFPLEHVLHEMFSLFGTIFKVSFELVPNIKLWHKEVKLYVMKDAQGVPRAHVALDLFPREGKYSHAAEFPIKRGFLKPDGSYNLPFVCMVANFPRSTNNIPSLLNHNEVLVLFHEFGHVSHDLLTCTPYYAHSGTAVALDFVEVPSQLLENWAWNEKILKRISSHYKTGESLNTSQIKNLIQTKNYLRGHDAMRQVIFAKFDMLLHTKHIENFALHYSKLVKKYTGVIPNKESLFPAGWGHMGEYAAGYYSYNWSLVYAYDIFSKFEEVGLLNSKIGMRYRTEILEQGSSRDEMDSIKAFLNRTPSDKAFLKSLGIKA